MYYIQLHSGCALRYFLVANWNQCKLYENTNHTTSSSAWLLAQNWSRSPSEDLLSAHIESEAKLISSTPTYSLLMGLMAKVMRALPKTHAERGPNNLTIRGPTKLLKNCRLSAHQEACACLFSPSIVKTYKTVKLQFQELYTLIELIWFKCRVLWFLLFIIQNSNSFLHLERRKWNSRMRMHKSI